ncbi:Two-component response regulator SSK1p [Basidiobolus ranarum]|uniref:Two-component response regulator SSK1p n=1 Tax=Basidiobolus ranarum TaxID=34480 RepID=A0ABR2VW72_9FUNG
MLGKHPFSDTVESSPITNSSSINLYTSIEKTLLSDDDQLQNSLPKDLQPTFQTQKNLSQISCETTQTLLRAALLVYLFCLACPLVGILLCISNSRSVSPGQIHITWSSIFYTLQVVIWLLTLVSLQSKLTSLATSLKYSVYFSFFIVLAELSQQTWMINLPVDGGFNSLKDWVRQVDFQLSTSENYPVLQIAPFFCFSFLLLLKTIDKVYLKDRIRYSTLVDWELRKLSDAITRLHSDNADHKALFIKNMTNELRNATSMAIETVKQLSPPELLVKPQEHVSACSIPVPTASVTAVHAALKHIINLSSHLTLVNRLLFTEESTVESANRCDSDVVEFDIGELVQSVGDMLAGTAAEAKVELVLFHADCGFHHRNVIGNEAGFRHALITMVKTVIDSASPGAWVELGLHLTPGKFEAEMESSKDEQIEFMFEIIYTPSITDGNSVSDFCPDANLTVRLVEGLGGELLASERDGAQVIELHFKLISGSKDPLKKDLSTIRNNAEIRRRLNIADEPSFEELTRFSLTLRGLKASLHATDHSIFAKHLTSCLTVCGLDITHHSTSSSNENIDPKSETAPKPISVPSMIGLNLIREETIKSTTPPTFIIIDDDIKTLRDQFISLRNNPAFNFSNHQHRRHRRMESLSNHLVTSIIHFTSLSNYQLIKDEVYSLLITPHHLLPPQVLVIPKPVGPKRLLTTLHTAITKPKVDPSYIPIATSPMSPGLKYHQTKEEEKNPMDFINFDTYRLPSENSNDTSSVSGLSVNNPSTPVTGTIVFDPKSYIGQNSVKSPLSRITNPVFTRRTSDQSLASTPGGYIKPSSGGLTPSNPSSISSPSPSINGKPIILPTNVLPRVSPSPSNLGASVMSSPTIRPSTVTSPSLSAPSPTQMKSTVALSATKASGGPTMSKATARKKSARFVNSTANASLSSVVSPPINVLIVEDNPINQTILSTFMRKRKIKYSVANNGLEAVQKWKEGGFHLVLMDIQLPVMDGIEATKEIRQLEKMQKIGFLSSPGAPVHMSSSVPTSPSSPFRSPVIIVALTASSLQSDRHAALAAGCNDFLTKPVSLAGESGRVKMESLLPMVVSLETRPPPAHLV